MKLGAVGVTNRVVGKPYARVLFLDYDGLTRQELYKELERLLVVHGELGELHILKTKDGWHVACLNEMHFLDAIAIQNFSHEDPMHHKFLKDHCVLRLTGKYSKRGVKKSDAPRYAGSVGRDGDRGMRSPSWGHYALYNQLFGVPVPPPQGKLVEKARGSVELVYYWTGD